MNITLLGCGRWGSFIAWYLDHNKNNVTVWGRKNDPLVESLFATRVNTYVTFPDSIELTNDLVYAVKKSDIIIISISSQFVRDLMSNVCKIDDYKSKIYVLCMKGIEDSTGKRLSEVLEEFGVPSENIAVWVGPGHIQEFTRGVPNCMIIDSKNKDLSSYLVDIFKSDLIKYYQGNDLIGTEIGAAAKNVLGIAAGMLDGLGCTVLKGALMARGTHEVARLMKACGGSEMSAYGLCHLGDFEATLFSPHSHNRMFGEKFVKGEPFEKLAEGAATASAMLKMAEKYKVDLPITKAVNDIIQHKKDPKFVLDSLFARNNKKEF